MVMLAKQAGARLVLLNANNKCTGWTETSGLFQTRSSDLKGQFSQNALSAGGIDACGEFVFFICPPSEKAKVRISGSVS